MTKTILSVALSMISLCSYAQKNVHGYRTVQPAIELQERTTATGDTVTMNNIPASATDRILYGIGVADSGYTSGTNVYNDRGFAERYSFGIYDSSVRVIGVMTLFGGHVNAGSDKTITLKLWQQGVPRMIAPNLYYEGFPDEVMDSLVVPVTNLGIGAGTDTLKTYYFPEGTTYLRGPFFAGYTMHYNFSATGADTVALMMSKDGTRNTPDYTLRYNTNTEGDTTSTDTLLNVQNATLWSDNIWHDNYTDNDYLYNHLAIFPVVITGTALSAPVVHNNMNLYGVYPNPAGSTAHIDISLSTGTELYITLTDMTGRVMYNNNVSVKSTGRHTIDVPTGTLPAGNYLVLVRTEANSGIAVKLSVQR